MDPAVASFHISCCCRVLSCHHLRLWTSPCHWQYIQLGQVVWRWARGRRGVAWRRSISRRGRQWPSPCSPAWQPQSTCSACSMPSAPSASCKSMLAHRYSPLFHLTQQLVVFSRLGTHSPAWRARMRYQVGRGYNFIFACTSNGRRPDSSASRFSISRCTAAWGNLTSSSQVTGAQLGPNSREQLRMVHVRELCGAPCVSRRSCQPESCFSHFTGCKLRADEVGVACNSSIQSCCCQNAQEKTSTAHTNLKSEGRRSLALTHSTVWSLALQIC